MQARMRNPAMLIPDALPILQSLGKLISTVDIPQKTQHVVHMRASQINGCAACIDMGVRAHAKNDTIERQLALPVWRESPLFTEPERAALALTEAITHISEEGVPDDVWAEAAKHYNETQLAGLVLYASTTNLWNRLNVATRQVPGAAW
jgi:AhpD family alkylhydroperoxidase